MRMKPIEPAASDVILVGDPRRAFALAQELMVQPRMSHQNRGLWGYTGSGQKGGRLTVQSTGSGGPSATSVIGDLAGQEAERMIRLGTCRAVEPGLQLGEVVLVERAIARDGASRALSQGQEAVRPDQRLFRALAGVGRQATISSHDLVERLDPDTKAETGSGPVIARDLQTAATFALCTRLGIGSAAILIVTDDQAGEQLGEDEQWEAFRAVSHDVMEKLNDSG